MPRSMDGGTPMIAGGSFDFDPDTKLYRPRWFDTPRSLPANAAKPTPRFVWDAIEIARRRWELGDR